jgi:hypothetical protein
MKRRGKIGFVAAVLTAVVMFHAATALAANRYWVGGSGTWNGTNTAVWSATSGGAGGVSVPVGGDVVYLDRPGTTVTYANPTSPTPVLGGLTVDATGSGTTLSQSGGYSLSASYEYVGVSNTGVFTQTGGVNAVTNGLSVGLNSGSTGTYNLIGAGTLSAGYGYIGHNGTGTFTQTGGTNTVTNTLYVGTNPGSTGTYSLSGTGQLSASHEYIGFLSSTANAFNQTGGFNSVVSLNLGYNSGSNGTYSLSGTGQLSAGSESVGYYGTGTFTQTGGTSTLTGILYLGTYSGSTGSYSLSGTSQLSVGLAEYIGLNGAGIFAHTAGKHTVASEISVGHSGGSTGTYSLSGTGQLSARDEYIGYAGTGTLTHTGGTNTITSTVTSSLYLGLNSVGAGTYNLSGTGQLTAVNEYIGYSGTGTFTQSGGTNAVTNTLTIAANPGSSGTYNLQAGTLTAGVIQVNSGGTFNQTGGSLNTGAFNQTGGTVKGSLQNNGAFTYTSGTFEGRLVNYGMANFNANFVAGNGMENNTSLSVGAGRTITLNGAGLTNNGLISLAGGVLNGDGQIMNNNVMSGYGTIGGTGGFVNNGSFSLTDSLTVANTGPNANFGQIDLAGSGKWLKLDSGVTLANQGVINLNSSLINGPGLLDNSFGGVISGRGTIVSPFANSAGTLYVDNLTTITNSFSNSGLISLTAATSRISGGDITNTGTIQGSGTVGNSIANSGTIETRGGDLTLSGSSVTNNSAGVIIASAGTKLLASNGIATNAGKISFNGGILDNNNKTMTSSGLIAGYGSFRTGGLTNSGTITLTGGPTTVYGDITNQATGKVQIAYNPAVIMGNVTNHGTVKITETTVTWAGNYTESGTYISDPAVNVITGDAVINANGNWIGGVGDEWRISGNFMNNSTQNMTWDTRSAAISLTGNVNHTFYLAGTDKGAEMTGYSNNFAWGTLAIEGGGSITLSADGTTGYAQYAGSILGLSFDSTGQVITNISEAAGSMLNVYYLASAADNAYLHSLTYNLTNGGHLIPVFASSVPIPPSAWLLAAGLAGLIGIRRRLTR